MNGLSCQRGRTRRAGQLRRHRQGRDFSGNGLQLTAYAIVLMRLLALSGGMAERKRLHHKEQGGSDQAAGQGGDTAAHLL